MISSFSEGLLQRCVYGIRQVCQYGFLAGNNMGRDGHARQNQVPFRVIPYMVLLEDDPALVVTGVVFIDERGGGLTTVYCRDRYLKDATASEVIPDARDVVGVDNHTRGLGQENI